MPSLSSPSISLLACLAVSACAITQAPAPVESRGTAPTFPAATTSAPSVQTPAAARPGYHVVKRGETLYSIALEHGQDYREVAAWNNVGNPALIREGQELRITPPEGITASRPAPGVAQSEPAVEARPIAPPPPLTMSGASSPAPASPSAAAPVGLPGSAPVKSEPRGGRLAYSEKAWKDLQAGIAEPEPRPAASAPAAVVPRPPAAASSPVASAPAPVPPVVPKATADDDDGMEWVWPAPGKVIAGFNDSTNKGIDIAGNAGDPVSAARSGRVIYVGSDLRGYGNLVIIKHAGNYLSAYAHNSEIYVKEQQQVQRGQKIAALGSSGTDRAKLHFEIRREGKPVDPLKFLPSR